MQTKSVPYTFVRKGYYYFSRRVPSDLQKHYSKDRIVVGLRTKSFSQAKSRAFVASAKLDEYWSHLRMTDPDILGHHLLRVPKTEQTFNLESSVGPACLSFGDALELYIDRKGNRRSKFFFAHAKRNSSYLIDVCGDKPLDMYRRSDALHFRDELLGRNLTGTTVTRILTTVRAIFNFAVSEHALDIRNPFIGLYHDRSAGVTERTYRTNSVTIIKQKSCAWMSQTICDPLPSHTPIKRHSMTPPLILCWLSVQHSAGHGLAP